MLIVRKTIAVSTKQRTTILVTRPDKNQNTHIVPVLGDIELAIMREVDEEQKITKMKK